MANVDDIKRMKETHCSMGDIPFKRSLSFEMLIAEIEKVANNKLSLFHQSAKDLLDKVDKVPELQKTINDVTLLQKHEELLDELMSFVFNPLSSEEEIAAAFAPFQMEPVFMTKRFLKTIGAENKKMELYGAKQEKDALIEVIYQAYFIILAKIYDVKLPVELPFVFKLTDTKNQSVKYYNKNFDTRYLQVKSIGKVKKLSTEQINSLFDQHNNLDYWNELIPLEKV